MNIINVEIKARCADPQRIEAILLRDQADFIGTDDQTDTYFNVPNCRLKLREGTIENALIHYIRADVSGPKKSEVMLYLTKPGSKLKDILTRAIGVKIVVRKKRKIYFAGNLKFHLDTVEELGSFVEIEAIDTEGTIGQIKLKKQCESYLKKFGIEEPDLISGSYSDMLMGIKTI